jgi:peptide/nickel transport system substrate-binding protein
VASAIDREHIAMLKPGTIRAASRIIPPGIPGYDPSPGQTNDYEAALAHMAAAGFPFDPRTKTGGYPREIVYITQNDSLDSRAAELAQQDLARIGIRIRLRAVGYPTYLAESGRRRSFAMGTDGWAADFPDPSDFFEPLFTTRAISDEDSQNRAFYASAQLDRLLDDARKATTWDARRSLYRRAEDAVLADAPWAVLYTNRWFDLWQPYLHGYRPNPAMSEHVGFTWIDERSRQRALSRVGAPPFARDAYAALFTRRAK